MFAVKPVKAKIELYAHQVEARDIILKSFRTATYQKKIFGLRIDSGYTRVPSPGFLLHDEVGVGKTVTSMSVLQDFVNTPRTLRPRYILVVPTTARENWRKQFKQFFGDQLKLREFTGTSTEKVKILDRLNGKRVLMVTYTTLSRLLGAYISTLNHSKLALSKDLAERVLTAFKGIKTCQPPAFCVDGPPHKAIYDKFPASKYKYDVRALAIKFFDYHWDFMIMDEVHKAKNRNSNCARALCIMKAEKRLGLSATPLSNRMKDLKGIFTQALGYSRSRRAHESYGYFFDDYMLGRKKENIKELSILPPVYYNITVDPNTSRMDKEMYMMFLDEAKRQKARASGDIEEATNMADHNKLQNAARQKFFSRVKTLSYISLHHSVVFENEKDLKENFNFDYAYAQAISNQKISMERSTAKKFFTFMLCFKKRMLFSYDKSIWKMIASYLGVVDVVPSAKMLATMDIYRHMRFTDPDDKLIVFSDSRRYLERVLHPWLTQNNVNAVLLLGGNKKKQEEAVRRFREDPKVKVLCTIKSVGGLARNFQAVSSTIIISDLSWTAADEEQAIGRIHRIGQRARPKVFTLMWPNSACTALRQLQYLKKRMSEGYLFEDMQTTFVDKVARNLDMDPKTALKGIVNYRQDRGLTPSAFMPHKVRLTSNSKMLENSAFRQIRKGLKRDREEEEREKKAQEKRARILIDLTLEDNGF